MTDSKPTGPRSIAVVGPYTSGKTTLLESMLFVTDAIGRKGEVTAGNTVGDSAQEARERNMSTEVNVASTKFLDDQLTFLDCPGSVELLQETLNILVGVDAAVVVAEPDADKALALAPIFKALENRGLPRLLFLNKMDKGPEDISSVLQAIGQMSAAPLVLRHMPLRNGEAVGGYIDLPSGRAFSYKANAASEQIEPPGEAGDELETARYEMLETLADFDDDLMEKVLEDVPPEKEEVYSNLTRDFQQGLIVPVLVGAGELDHGVRRLLKFLRHEVPAASESAARVGAPADGSVVAQVLKTYHTQHAGKLSISRVWSGSVKDGMTLNGERVAGLFRMLGHNTEKIAEAGAGEVVGLARLDSANTGQVLTDGKEPPALPAADLLTPVFSLAINAEKRDDEVKLSGALARLVDEDPSTIYEQVEATHELVLRGQGDIHLRLAADRLRNKYGLAVNSRRPRVPYKEAIRKSVEQHGRHKKQSGGHGQFGDVHLSIKPLPRGTGFEFKNSIVGGVVPRQYIPAVENGVKEYLVRGPLGFPVVDVFVELYDGQHHAVDSSEIAFKTAGRIAMSEGMPKCSPVLLEPFLNVQVMVPSEFTPKVNQVISGRRGQVLGFDARPGWTGWDVVNASMPESEMHDIIVELRSLTQGVATFKADFDRLQELTGRLADQVISERDEEQAA
ncbi:MAG: elongation factor G [Alphaproteobacteria bacterium]|jgi:elongation factor G|nr:elongation factor G [Alphaproteobacteria bacterium]